MNHRAISVIELDEGTTVGVLCVRVVEFQIVECDARGNKPPIGVIR